MVELDELTSDTPSFKAKAFIDYDKNYKATIVCQEPSCNFYDDGSCLNKKNAIINDDCPTDQFCESYISKV